jgi:hypothetical protein
MQLVREIEVGMDIDGDAVPDLDPSRIYYVGNSGGGRQGAIFLAVEPSVRAGVLTVPSGSIEERLSAVRGGFGPVLQSRVPLVINSPGITTVNGILVSQRFLPYFDENVPLRNGAPFTVVLQDQSSRIVQSPVTNTVPGATEIQQVLENIEWASQSGGSVAYAPYIRRDPLTGVAPKSVIIQFAFGDRLSVNPSTTVLLRAGDLADRATFFRTDISFPVNPNPSQEIRPFIRTASCSRSTARTRTSKRLLSRRKGRLPRSSPPTEPAMSLIPSTEPRFSDPDGPGPIFEVPIALPLPETLNYYP